MLRSYTYTDQSYNDLKMHNSVFWEKENFLAKSFVLGKKASQDFKSSCPCCKSTDIHFCYTKWTVNYFKCGECKSIFAACGEEEVAAYKEHGEIIQLRLTKKYQDAITVNREERWREFADWLGFRTFRFLGRSVNLNVIDYGNRLDGFVNLLKTSDLCADYNLRQSILQKDDSSIKMHEADVVLYLDQIKTELEPQLLFRNMRSWLKEGGLLIIDARAAGGFDITTLREHNDYIYPYEHILLPSICGLTVMLNECGFDVLEITTPGMMDIKYVMNSIDKLGDREEFVRQLLSESTPKTLQEFQRFLQKNSLSSFVRVVAQKHAGFEGETCENV